MIFLLFQIGADGYAIEAKCVEEVLPRVQLKTIPHAMAGVAGVFNYHGEPVPVVDLTAMMLGHPSSDSLSTRLLVVRMASDDGEARLVGLLAEKATQIEKFKEEDFQVAGVSAAGTSYLGPVVNHCGNLIQRVNVERLLSPAARSQLWQQAREVA